MTSVKTIISKPIIAVTMATGLQGRGVVAQLSKSHKYHIKAITRNPESDQALKLSKLPNVELCKADLLDFNSLENCFKNAYGIFGNTTPTKGWQPLVREYEIAQGRILIDIVKKINSQGFLKHFVFSSICKAKDPLKNIPSPSHFSSKWDIEDYLMLNGLKNITTIVRPVSYFENFDSNLPGLKITDTTFPGVVKPNKIWQTIAVEDIGHWTLAIFKNPEKFLGESLNIAGEELTGNQMAEVMESIKEIKSRKVSYKMIPRALMKLFVHDIGIMADWIERTGYGADLEKLRLIAKEEDIQMTPLSTWLKQKNKSLVQ